VIFNFLLYFHVVESWNSTEQSTTTVQSSKFLQYLITKPNSYLYNIDEDDENLLERVKRDTTPFVCQS